MDWQMMATLLRLTEMHLEAWQQALIEARLIVSRYPRDARIQGMESLVATAHALMDQLQYEQDRLCELRSRKLAAVFRLRDPETGH